MENTKYVIIKGECIEVSTEVRKALNKAKDHVFYTAHKEGTCGITDYTLCCGDCGYCRYKVSGKTVSLDDPRFHILNSAPGHAPRSGYAPTDTNAESVEAIGENKDTFARILAYAKTICDRGDELFKLHYQRYSTYEISDITGIPQKTVYRRVQKICLSLGAYYNKHFTD